MLELSDRIINMPESPIRKLHPYSEQAKNKGIKIYHVNIGQPDIKTPPELIKAVKEHSEQIIGYTPSQGNQNYTKTISEYYKNHGFNIEIDEILVTTGGSEAILFALMATADPGDDIIVPEPFYANYNSFAYMAGINIIPITTYLEDGFKLPNKSELIKKLTPKTKAVLFSSPSNPTGTVYTREQLDELCNFCLENNIYIIADEAYYEITQKEKIISMLNLLEEKKIEKHLIIVDSISKRFSSCGARIGRLVSKNKKIITQVLKFAQARLSPPYYGQILGEAALKLPDSYLSNLASKYQERINVTCSELKKIKGLKYHHSEGAFYIIVKLPDNINGEKFAKFLLEEFYSINPETNEKETIMVAPASGFYKSNNIGNDEIRIACVLKKKDMKRSIDILKEAINKFKL